METAAIPAVIFLLLAMLFLILAWRRQLSAGTSSLTARIWLRVGVIFALVSGCLFLYSDMTG